MRDVGYPDQICTAGLCELVSDFAQVILGIAILGLYVGMAYMLRAASKDKKEYFAKLNEFETRYQSLSFEKLQLSTSMAILRGEIQREIKPLHDDLTKQGRCLGELKTILQDAVEKIERISPGKAPIAARRNGVPNSK